jgi:hypothetical protein
MRKQKPMGLLINGSLKQSGVTFYLRKGQMVARTAHSHQPKRRTRAQFIARQQLAHSCRLWAELRWAAEPLFDTTPSAYARFRTLMRRTPVVFVPQRGPLEGATLLLPGMPVSDGVLPVVAQWLGEVDGIAALLTSLTPDSLRRGDTLRLYTLQQCIEGQRPMVRVSAADLSASDFQIVDGCLALVGEEYADDMTGWAVVHMRGTKCSSQQVVTRCTYFEPFTTEEALLSAATSYGGLTE